MQFIIITGISGAGKSTALNYFEDSGYFCVDNLPPVLLSKFAELCSHSELDKIAVVSDIRGGKFFDDLTEKLNYLEENQIEHEILFLETSDRTLVDRYKETRRRHPLEKEGRVLDAIRKERKRLEQLRGKANNIIDTTDISIKELKERLKRNYISNEEDLQSMAINIISFGFKYGIPMDSDMVFDVRFLANPYYVDSLKKLTGLDQEVKDYILKWPNTSKFYDKFFDLINFLVPEYEKEGKSHLSIAIGCTGGHHRSVTTAVKLKNILSDMGYKATVNHRDINK
ncbi:MAG: RNase adapter RapZ [Halanaerobiales bacterium]|nr:RNase adapter RapZ [Halanaerobiales bacterium]MCF8008381.1 RNase adapter RapZ [Halanaerobiales bacterium]